MMDRDELIRALIEFGQEYVARRMKQHDLEALPHRIGKNILSEGDVIGITAYGKREYLTVVAVINPKVTQIVYSDGSEVDTDEIFYIMKSKEYNRVFLSQSQVDKLRKGIV